jgi:hypothetical protein
VSRDGRSRVLPHVRALLAAGAVADRSALAVAVDTLWDGTPLDWALPAGNEAAAAALRSAD